MPRLVLFAVCEKAVIDQQTNVVSLLSLLENINVQIPAGSIVPANAAIPITWATATILQLLPEDTGKTFEQRTAFVNNVGMTQIETPIAPFQFKPAAIFHRIVSTIVGMPIGSAGLQSVKCLLREKGTTNWTEIGSYPIQINWTSVVPPTIIH